MQREIVKTRQEMLLWGLEGVLSPLHHSHYNSDALVGHSEAFKELIAFRKQLAERWPWPSK